MARPKISEAEAFAMLEGAAASGARCPITGTGGLTSQLTAGLARAGKIRIGRVSPQLARRHDHDRSASGQVNRGRLRTRTGGHIFTIQKDSPPKPPIYAGLAMTKAIDKLKRVAAPPIKAFEPCQQAPAHSLGIEQHDGANAPSPSARRDVRSDPADGWRD